MQMLWDSENASCAPSHWLVNVRLTYTQVTSFDGVNLSTELFLLVCTVAHMMRVCFSLHLGWWFDGLTQHHGQDVIHVLLLLGVEYLWSLMVWMKYFMPHFMHREKMLFRSIYQPVRMPVVSSTPVIRLFNGIYKDVDSWRLGSGVVASLISASATHKNRIESILGRPNISLSSITIDNTITFISCTRPCILFTRKRSRGSSSTTRRAS